MKTKKQLFIIHGGMTFKNKKDYIQYLKNREIRLKPKVSWRNEYLNKNLGKTFEIIAPQMPLQDNAKYEDWKIYFERFFPYLKNDIVLVGVSLGGIFLAKYLSENKFPKKIRSVYLVCPPFDNTMSEEDLAGGFNLKSDITLLEKQPKNLYLMFSKDDKVVPVSHAEKYRKKLKNPVIKIYKSKNGHFKTPTFPEIIKMIKNDFKK